jgi:hypothetical protein
MYCLSQPAAELHDHGCDGVVEPDRDHASSNSTLDVADDVTNGRAEVHLPRITAQHGEWIAIVHTLGGNQLQLNSGLTLEAHLVPDTQKRSHRIKQPPTGRGLDDIYPPPDHSLH